MKIKTNSRKRRYTVLSVEVLGTKMIKWKWRKANKQVSGDDCSAGRLLVEMARGEWHQEKGVGQWRRTRLFGEGARKGNADLIEKGGNRRVGFRIFILKYVAVVELWLSPRMDCQQCAIRGVRNWWLGLQKSEIRHSLTVTPLNTNCML